MSAPRACILSVSGDTLAPSEAQLISRVDPWGVILMGRSCRTRAQARALVDAIWSASGRPTLIFIDQEGGRVRRLRPPEWPDFPAPDLFGRLWLSDPQAAVEACWLHHRLIAAELEPLGILADFAPVLDLRHAGAHVIVGDRSFGADPHRVAALGRAALEGLEAGGVAGAVKHIPGHGRARVDSHDETPVIDEPIEALEEDFAPFAMLRDAPMALTAHLRFNAIDRTACATHSRIVVSEIIRDRIGFRGLLVTDDLGMKALGGTLADRAARAFAAGCDVALHCSGFVTDPSIVLREMEEVADASPELSGAAQERAAAVERATLNRKPFDVESGWSDFRSLIAGSESLNA
ncbi:beta-N-acetylhexosaminidase [bacterium]|nr:beta-N-acetylhexosaminidase [bacterium]